MQSAEEHSSNGHTKSFWLRQLNSLVKQLPETETAKTPNSVTVTTEELLQTLFSDSWLELLSATLSKKFSSLQNHLLSQHRGFILLLDGKPKT